MGQIPSGAAPPRASAATNGARPPGGRGGKSGVLVDDGDETTKVLALVVGRDNYRILVI